MEYKTTIESVFSPRKHQFAVPNYQRAYSWDLEPHVQQFLKDLNEHPDSVAQYHLGHFLFEHDEGVPNKYLIIDGQQRMTTLIIFLSCIYQKLMKIPAHEKDAKNMYLEFLKNIDDQQKFLTVEYDNNYFLTVVLEGKTDKANTRSKSRIQAAYEYFQQQVEKAGVETVLRWKHLIETAKITTDTINDKAEATQIFTFQNDRGKELTNLEKLKAYLMQQVYLASKSTGRTPNDIIGFIEKEFETIYHVLERITIANEDQVLNYHTIAFLPSADNSIDRIKNVLSKEPIDAKQKWIKQFIVQLKKSFQIIIEIEEKVKTHSNVADLLFLDQPNSFPLVLKLYHLHDNDDRLENIFRLVEIILFRLQYSTGNYYTNSLPSIAHRYSGDLEELRGQLLWHAKSGFQHYWNFERDFHLCLEGDYHYWAISRYLLWKHENSLREKVRDKPMLYPEFKNLVGSRKWDSTIDHWMPQNPDEVEYDLETKEKYLNNIGNLVLATLSRNASDGNNLPGERSTISTLISRQMLESQKGNWGKEAIKNRQSEIVEFAKRHWDPNNIH